MSIEAAAMDADLAELLGVDSPTPSLPAVVAATAPPAVAEVELKLTARQKTLLNEWGESRDLESAMATAGINLAKLSIWRKTSAAFALGFEGVLQAITESEIISRAVVGVDEPLSFQGVLTGHSITRKSDALLKFLATSKHPDFKEESTVKHDHSGQVQHNHSITPPQITESDAMRRSAEAQRLLDDLRAIPAAKSSKPALPVINATFEEVPAEIDKASSPDVIFRDVEV